MKIEAFPTFLRFVESNGNRNGIGSTDSDKGDGSNENSRTRHYQHNASLAGLVAALDKQNVTAINAELFTASDYVEGRAEISIHDYRVLNQVNQHTHSHTHPGIAGLTQTQARYPLRPSIVAFGLMPSQDAVCAAIVRQLCNNSNDKQSIDKHSNSTKSSSINIDGNGNNDSELKDTNFSVDPNSDIKDFDPDYLPAGYLGQPPRVLVAAAEIEARILAATEPLCLDPSPAVAVRETLTEYNRSKYRVPPRALAATIHAYELELELERQHQHEHVYTERENERESESLQPRTNHSNESHRLPPSPRAADPEHASDSEILTAENSCTANASHTNNSRIHKLMLVNDYTCPTSGGAHGLARDAISSSAAAVDILNPFSTIPSSNNSSVTAQTVLATGLSLQNSSVGNGNDSSNTNHSNSIIGFTDTSASVKSFQPRFTRLQFIEEFRKRKHSFDTELVLGLDVRRVKPKIEKRDPEYLVLNGTKVVRTVRFEQKFKQGTLYTILNIVETNVPDEHEAILRMGNIEGNAIGNYSGTLRYPVGNIAAVDNYLGYFKSFYGLTNTMINALATMSTSGGGSAGP
ncbi:hypothetical protein HK100_003599 [Physocladia obscura]|uniref:Uncharacterized protein n=1 Tax=Physocladia obscura TaxID=109957 RepID=A0AAD5T7P5_9FUNG|nr:hypothetical protein HK100_003599 [Physocladia obscura]